VKLKDLKPTAAIKEHCKWYCMNDHFGLSNCVTPSCHLRKKKSALQRIRDWCKECAADFKPWECTGEVLNTEYTRKWKCPLHPYRMGKNSRLKHNRTPHHLKKYRYKSGSGDTTINDNQKKEVTCHKS
jgi:hypothetical protein